MKPILFNTDMVRAILEGRKTVTRRVVKFNHGQNPQWTGYIPDGHVLYGSNNIPAAKAPYRPGDILYVRETWAKSMAGTYIYKSTDTPLILDRWLPSIHMPKEAARLFLRVTDVRVERLQDITDEQAKAEGVQGFFLGMGESGYAVRADSNTFYEGPVGAFASLWNSTIKPADRNQCGWEANPWVWVINFERISCDEAQKGGEG